MVLSPEQAVELGKSIEQIFVHSFWLGFVVALLGGFCARLAYDWFSGRWDAWQEDEWRRKNEASHGNA